MGKLVDFDVDRHNLLEYQSPFYEYISHFEATKELLSVEELEKFKQIVKTKIDNEIEKLQVARE